MKRSAQCSARPETLPSRIAPLSPKPNSPTRIDHDFARSHSYPSQPVPLKPSWSQPVPLPPLRNHPIGYVHLPPLQDSSRTDHYPPAVPQRHQSPVSSSTSQPVCVRYTPEQRREAVRRFKEKKSRKKNQSSAIRYQVRKRLADTRPRYRGRFYKPKPSTQVNDDEIEN